VQLVSGRSPYEIIRPNLAPSYGVSLLHDLGSTLSCGRRLVGACRCHLGSRTVKVLVVGSGAREHALVRALVADPAVTKVVAAPGNAGIAAYVETREVRADDPAAVAALATELAVDLVVVGAEGPLVAGVADAVRKADIPCFGPDAAAARLEGSKAFAKDVMAAAGVPTSKAHVCVTSAEYIAAFDDFGPPYVVKDDGLAAGKGVVVTSDRPEASAHAEACLAKLDGRVVIEEYLAGPEVSLFCLTDGLHVVPLQPAQDFKRALDGDEGPNTGGMGAYSPLPWAPDSLVEEVVRHTVQPTVDELRGRGTPFVGVIYVGLALTTSGPKVIEFNARFGDPETQVVLARLRSPFGALLLAAATGELASVGPLEWSGDSAVGVVVAAANYPGHPRTGDVITGLAAAAELPGVSVLHAGTIQEGEDVVSAGGRVLTVVGLGTDLVAARDAAYDGISLIELAGAHHRGDIALAASLGEIKVS
jgi:phosphoribosylamine--glycine ligase